MIPDPTDAGVQELRRMQHLSRHYALSLARFVWHVQVGASPALSIADDAPGFRETWDLVDLVLQQRAELRVLRQALVRAGLLDAGAEGRQLVAEERALVDAKGRQFGFTVSAAGVHPPAGGGGPPA